MPPTPPPPRLRDAVLPWALQGLLFAWIELAAGLFWEPEARRLLGRLWIGLGIYPLLGLGVAGTGWLVSRAFARIPVRWKALHASLSAVFFPALFALHWLRVIYPLRYEAPAGSLVWIRLALGAGALGVAWLTYLRLRGRERPLRTGLVLGAVYALLTVAGLHVDGLNLPKIVSLIVPVQSWGVVVAALGIGALLHLLLGLIARRGVARGLGALLLAAIAVFSIRGSVGDRSKEVASRGAGPPNILLITLDALRADHLGSYGASGLATPNIDRLAAEGVRFERVRAAAPWTLPSLTSLFSSLYPSVHGAGRPAFEGGPHFLTARPGIPWLPSLLRERGYATQALVNNGLAGRAAGMDRGFDGHYNLFDRYLRSALVEEGRGFLWSGLLGGATRELEPRPTQALTERALEWLGSAPRPFFLWIHFLDPHLPYERSKRYGLDPGYRGKLADDELLRRMKPEDIKTGVYQLTPDDRRHLASIYAEEVQLVDEEVGRILELLESEGLLERTVVALSSDHGEELWDHGGFEHGHSLYRELLDVPLLLRYPAALPQGKLVEAQVQLIDLAPTLLELVGGREEAFQGESLLPLIRGEADADRPAFAEFLVFGEELKALEAGRFKVIFAPYSGRLQLFDLEADPAETRSIAHSDPERAREMVDRLVEWARRNQERAAALGEETDQPFAPDAVTRERLEALGYLQ